MNQERSIGDLLFEEDVDFAEKYHCDLSDLRFVFYGGKTTESARHQTLG